MNNLSKQYDIIIIGAGMVGLVCAHLLKDCGLRIAVCEANVDASTWQADDYDIRVSALNKNSQQLFESIGCWSAIQTMRVGPYDQMKIWEQEGDYQLDFSAADNAQDYLGYIVENSALKKALLDNFPSNIDLLCPIKFTALEQGEIMRLIADDGTMLSAKLIIGADGGNSWLRSAAGIETKTYAYNQQAIVATVKTEYSHNQTAYQCFLPTGPLAFLPLEQKLTVGAGLVSAHGSRADTRPAPTGAYYSSIVWSADDALAKQLLVLPAQEFSVELTKIMCDHLGKVEVISEIKSFPLHMRHATDYIKPGIALIGDAIRTIHPLAGQGVNLGFKDAEVLAKVIKIALTKNKNFASDPILKKYQRARKSETIAMIVAMEFFKQAFAKSNLKSARATVIEQINKYSFVKDFFTKMAGGI